MQIIKTVNIINETGVIIRNYIRLLSKKTGSIRKDTRLYGGYSQRKAGMFEESAFVGELHVYM